MAKICISLTLLFCLWGALGCDYGVPQDEVVQSENEYCMVIDEAYSEIEAALNLGDTDWFDIKKMGVIDRIPPFSVVAPADFVLEQYKEKNEYGSCNCAEVCTICADAFICGHEATAAQACQECAKCQQDCNTGPSSE